MHTVDLSGTWTLVRDQWVGRERIVEFKCERKTAPVRFKKALKVYDLRGSYE